MSIMYYKNGQKYVKVFQNGKIEQIDLETMEVSRLDVLPDDMKKTKSSEYRFAQHSFFNSREFEWEWNGKSYRTEPLNDEIKTRMMRKAQSLFSDDDIPIFYLGKVWRFQWFMADCSFDCCSLIRKWEGGQQTTITKAKNLKMIVSD